MTAAEIQTQLNAGDKAAPQQVVDFVKAKGVASLKVRVLLGFHLAPQLWPIIVVPTFRGVVQH